MAGRIGNKHLDLLQSCFGCDAETARAIASQGEEQAFAARAIVIRAGDTIPHSWFMLDGAAQAIAYTASGQHVLVHGYAAGDLFGALSGPADIAGDTEVRTVGPADIARFRQFVFLALMENHACVALTVTRQLARRLSETARRMVEVATLSTGGRIHAELLRRARKGDGLAIRPAPVLSEFALDVQSTRETVSRAMSQLERRGIIIRTADALQVVAPHRLEDLIY